MTSQKVLISKTIENAKDVLKKNENWPDDAKAVVSSLLDVLSIVTNSLGPSAVASRSQSSTPFLSWALISARWGRHQKK